MKTNIKTFAEVAKAASKFTFQALLVKKTKKPTAALLPPAANTRSQFAVPQAPPPERKGGKHVKLAAVTSEDILICTSSASNNANTMKYEDFCGELFMKDNDDYTYETAKLQQTNIAVEASKSERKSNGKCSSYRRSRSGMYKVDIQSSILELDDEEHVEKQVVEKLDTIVEVIPAPVPQEVPVMKMEDDGECLNKVEVVVSEDDYYEMNGEKRDVKFYRELVILETKQLNELGAKWDCCINEAPEDGKLI